MWLEKNGRHSILITSDYLFHNIYLVLRFMNILVSGNLNRYAVLSDGAPTQFKQKFTMCGMALLPNSLGWNFLATSHRKGQQMELELELRMIYLTQH